MVIDPIPDSPEQMARQLRAIYASTSWRITAPLRWLGNLLPALPRRWRAHQPAALCASAGSDVRLDPVQLHDAGPIPPRWPGQPAPAVLWRQQLDAAIERSERARCS